MISVNATVFIVVVICSARKTTKRMSSPFIILFLSFYLAINLCKGGRRVIFIFCGRLDIGTVRWIWFAKLKINFRYKKTLFIIDMWIETICDQLKNRILINDSRKMTKGNMSNNSIVI